MRKIQTEHEQSQQRLPGKIKIKTKFRFYESNLYLEPLHLSSTDPFLQEKSSLYTYPNHFQKPTAVLQFVPNKYSLPFLIYIH